MANKKLRRVIEVQSDLYQKGNLERDISSEQIDSSRRVIELNNKEIESGVSEERKLDLLSNNREHEEVIREQSKLQQYNDPTAHFRMIREEIRSATLDGKDVLQFPTGETAMKIEGWEQQIIFTN